MDKLKYAVILGLPLLMASCHNGDIEHPDFDYQTIYFANQTPVQTITLGEDGEFDVSMDNDHRFQIYATLGGVNTNKSQRWAEYKIDNSLVDGLTFEDGTPVKALPESYYEITNEKGRLYIKKGEVMGAIDIHLTDAFFNDPESPNVCYVIPVLLTNASDSILSGEAKPDFMSNPNVLDETQWNTVPQNYVLYGIKYKNKWHGTWLSRGTVTVDGVSKTHEHPDGWWEREEIHYLTTKSLTECHYAHSKAVPVTLTDGTNGETMLNCDVVLKIADNGDITATSGTEGCTVTGTGKYTYHGAGQAWGSLDRDKMELNFTITIPYVKNQKTGETAECVITVEETMVSRDRQNKFETFTYVLPNL